MRILFLQGNATPFFGYLGKELSRRGHEVSRVTFNGGDDFLWRHGRRYAFRAPARNWDAFFTTVLAEARPHAILLFGQWRRFHHQAIQIAEARGIPVWIFDESYVRPGRIRMERAGPGGCSQVPADTIGVLAADSVPEDAYNPRLAPSTFRERAILDISYHTLRALTWVLYPHYRFHAPVSPFFEYLGYARRLSADLLGLNRRNHILPSGRYFFFPMQMDGDFQLRARSRFESNHGAVSEVIASFAAHASADSSLVFKLHPLDNGLTNWKRFIQRLAHERGVGSRVFYVEGGDLVEMLAAAEGVVTVNSTAGLVALELGCPIVTLGQAIYNFPELTWQNGLDRFWLEANKPDPTFFRALRRVIIERTTVPGDYYSHEGRKLGVRSAADRLEKELSATEAHLF